MSARGHLARIARAEARKEIEANNTYRTAQVNNVTSKWGTVTGLGDGTVTVDVGGQSVTVNVGQRWLNVGDAVVIYGNRAN